MIRRTLACCLPVMTVTGRMHLVERLLSGCTP
jgi:hypothetical protein